MAGDGSPPAPHDSVDICLLHFHARVAGPSPTISAVRSIFPPGPSWLPGPGEGEPTRLDVRVPGDAGELYRIVRDGVVGWQAPDAADVVGPLEWTITNAALERLAERYVLFHGGAVGAAGGSGEVGILLPAASGSGKTTLVAGLVAAGFAFLSDEVAILDPATGALLPLPRALCVKASSLPVLASLYPNLAAGPRFARFGGEKVTYLTPPATSWPGAPVPVGVVVLPRYVAGAATTLQLIPRPAAMRTLLEQSFSAHRQGSAAVTAVVDLLRDVPCYALTIGDLDRAVNLLRHVSAVW